MNRKKIILTYVSTTPFQRVDVYWDLFKTVKVQKKKLKDWTIIK